MCSCNITTMSGKWPAEDRLSIVEAVLREEEAPAEEANSSWDPNNPYEPFAPDPLELWKYAVEATGGNEEPDSEADGDQPCNCDHVDQELEALKQKNADLDLTNADLEQRWDASNSANNELQQRLKQCMAEKSDSSSPSDQPSRSDQPGYIDGI